jgi:hypothetical protein
LGFFVSVRVASENQNNYTNYLFVRQGRSGVLERTAVPDGGRIVNAWESCREEEKIQNKDTGGTIDVTVANATEEDSAMRVTVGRRIMRRRGLLLGRQGGERTRRTRRQTRWRGRHTGVIHTHGLRIWMHHEHLRRWRMLRRPMLGDRRVKMSVMRWMRLVPVEGRWGRWMERVLHGGRERCVYRRWSVCRRLVIPHRRGWQARGFGVVRVRQRWRRETASVHRNGRANDPHTHPLIRSIRQLLTDHFSLRRG